MPEATPQAHPVPLAAAYVTPAGSGSVTVTSEAGSGPAFAVESVYASVPSGATGSGPSDFVIDRPAAMAGVTVSVSEALSLPGTGSSVPAGDATVAVLRHAPARHGHVGGHGDLVGRAAREAGRAKDPPASYATDGGAEHWPGVTEQATAVTPSPDTTGSARTAPVTPSGPLFVTRTV